MLVRIAKDWDWPDLLRQTPGGKGIWGDVRFTTDDIEECDVLVMLNNRMKHSVHAKCPKGRVWALMQEPYARDLPTGWSKDTKLSTGYTRIISRHPTRNTSPHNQRSRGTSTVLSMS